MSNVNVRVDSPNIETATEERVEVELQPLNLTSNYILDALQILEDRDWTNVEEFLNPWSPQRITLVHITAYRGNLEELKRADTLHADLRAKDDFGRCALYYAADQGHAHVLRWLLQRLITNEAQNEPGNSAHSEHPPLQSNKDDRSDEVSRRDRNVQDNEGRTPLHAAIYGGDLECIRILIKEGFSLASKTKHGVSVADAIFEQIPDPVAFLTEILDEQVSAIDNSGNEVVLDFMVLTTPLRTGFRGIEDKDYSDLHVVLALIDAIPNMEQREILQHPLLATFLHQKYIRATPPNLIIFFLHAIIIMFLSWHVICMWWKDEACTKWIPAIPLIALLGLLVLDIAGTTLGILRSYSHFHRNEVLMCMRLVFATIFGGFLIIVIFPELACEDTSCNDPSGMLHHTAIIILLAWTNMMLVLDRFSLVGGYPSMFLTVLLNIGKVFPILLYLIMGFALSFLFLFPGNRQFNTPLKALAKTLVMMTGEYDYDALFPPTDQNTSLPITSTIVLLIFVMVTSIGLMNLMVGLAVSDIQQLLTEGRTFRLMMLAKSAADWIAPVVLLSRLFGYSRGHLTKMSSRTIALDLKSPSWISWRGIPADIRKALRNLAMKNLHNHKKQKTNSSNTENREDGLAAIQSSLQRILIEQQKTNSSNTENREDGLAAIQSSLQRILIEQQKTNSSNTENREDGLAAIQSSLQRILIEQQKTNSSNTENREDGLAAIQSSLQRILIEQKLQNSQIQQLKKDLKKQRDRRSL